MESEQFTSKVIKDIRFQFAKYYQQAACSFQTTRYYLEGSCQTAISQQILYNIMKVETSNRTQWMINALIKLTKKFSFFAYHALEAEECCKYMQYRKIPAHSEIITYGTDPDFFYIVFEGEAAIFVKRTGEEIQQERKKLQNKSKDETIATDTDTDLLSRKYFLQKGVCKFKYANLLGQGEAFGQLGMLYNRPRMALVVAKTPCIVGALRKDDYVSIFFEQEKQLRNRKKKFISEEVLTQLKNLRYEAMQGILYRFQQKTLKINEFLFRQNDIFQTFYIVYQGQILFFNQVGRNKKPLARIGRGATICADELKLFLNKKQSSRLKYSAQVCSSSVTLYKLQAVEALKISDYREVFGSILKSLPEVHHEQSKPLKPILKQIPSTQPNQTLSQENLTTYLKNVLMTSIPQASKEAVALNRIKRMQSKKENRRTSVRRLSKFRMSVTVKNVLNLLNDSTISNFAGINKNSSLAVLNI